MASDASDRICAGEAVSFFQSGDLRFSVSGDHDDFVDAYVYAGFEEEWDFVDDHSMGFALGDPAHEPLLLAGDAGMDDAFELPSFLRIVEDDASEGLTVERVVLVEDCLPKLFDDGSPGRFPWFDNLTGQFIGIDQDGAASLEHLRDGTLAGCDTACEADQNHGAEDTMGLLKKSSDRTSPRIDIQRGALYEFLHDMCRSSESYVGAGPLGVGPGVGR